MSQDAIKLDIDGLRSRNDEALRQLFDYLLPVLRRRAEWEVRRFGRHALDADELANEALMKIYGNLDRYLSDDVHNEDDFKRLLTLSSHRTITYLTRRRWLRESRRLSRECDTFEMESSAPQGSSQESDEAAALAVLEQMLNNLSESDRDIMLKRLAGMSLSEIAETQNLAPATVYHRYQRILRQLREQFIQSGDYDV